MGMPSGYKCRCRKFNTFSVWVFTHWNERITHQCECGRRNELVRGRVILVGEPASQTKEIQDAQRV